jgi:ubiquinone/menaquinone biosynthesis C-methylase UbiE
MNAVRDLPFPVEAWGLPYEIYHGFHDVMAESSHRAVAKRLLEQVLPLAPGLEAKLRAGICVLDVGCGKGRALLPLAREFPNSRFIGYDLCQATIEHAQALASESQLTNLAFYRYDAAQMQDEAALDLVTAFDAIHDQKDPAAVLSNIYRAVKRGGTFLMQDIAGSMDVQMLHDAGFRNVEIGKIPQDIMNVYYVCRKE